MTISFPKGSDRLKIPTVPPGDLKGILEYIIYNVKIYIYTWFVGFSGVTSRLQLGGDPSGYVNPNLLMVQNSS